MSMEALATGAMIVFFATLAASMLWSGINYQCETVERRFTRRAVLITAFVSMLLTACFMSGGLKARATMMLFGATPLVIASIVQLIRERNANQRIARDVEEFMFMAVGYADTMHVFDRKNTELL